MSARTDRKNRPVWAKKAYGDGVPSAAVSLNIDRVTIYVCGLATRKNIRAE